jgi:antitoxin (DNA-binding transcriptional repressor) of toxin-antitoxin stability system
MKSVNSGEEIILTHRFYGSIKLSPLPQGPTNDPNKGLNAFLEAPKKTSRYPKNQSIKKLYSESLTKKYG